jgi:hypothetical protein
MMGMSLKDIKPRKIAIGALACLGFGVLMAWRDSLNTVWQRAMVAGCAFALLALTYGLLARHQGDQDSVVQGKR